MQLQPNIVFDNHYTLIRQLGRGGFSEVWLAHDSYMDLDVALKIYAPGQGMDEHSIDELRREIKVVFTLNHPNLLTPKYLGVWDGMPYLVLAYCSRGSLTQQIGKLPEQELWHVLHDVAAGLAYLHKNDIVHQDIKPDNILIDDSGNYVITDFGISAKARSTLRKSVIGGAVSGGTTAYMGPERFSRQPAPTKASDIWSFGAMVYEVLEGNVPFGEVGGGLQKGGAEIPIIQTNVSDELKSVITKMLQQETWDRPTAEELTVSNVGESTSVGHTTQRMGKVDEFPQGSIKGVFSVSDTKKVVFSRGNLQYRASTNTWRFAEHQYDMVGIGYGQTDKGHGCYVIGTVPNSDNREISSTYGGWIDKFGWGTGNNPINTSKDYDDYPTFVDWGVNKISNGGNQANLWRTLTNDEWTYLLENRPNASRKQGVAMVNGVNGLVLLPDNWTLPSGAHFTSGYADDYGYEYYKTVNTYTVSEWALMESAGAVFLPATSYFGYPDGTYDVGDFASYWSSTEYETDRANYMGFDSEKLYLDDISVRYDRDSVRLCSEFLSQNPQSIDVDYGMLTSDNRSVDSNRPTQLFSHDSTTRNVHSGDKERSASVTQPSLPKSKTKDQSFFSELSELFTKPVDGFEDLYNRIMMIFCFVSVVLGTIFILLVIVLAICKEYGWITV